jgi:hypothetical protein
MKEDTHILVYTSTSFKDIIKEHRLFDDAIIHFEINNTYSTIEEACKSRLDVFQFDSIKKYDKVLYLDIDIIVKDDIHKVFDVCKENILYVLEEGTVNEVSNIFDNEEETKESPLMGETKVSLPMTGFSGVQRKKMEWGEISNYEDKSAFSTGIMLFNNCKIMRFLFYKIKEDMKETPHDFSNHEVPYIVYNAFKYNLFDNKALKPFAVNNEFNICSDKVIHHFPGGTGIFHHKRHIMSYFLNNLNEYTTFVKEGEGGLFDFVEDCVMPVIDVCFWLWSAILVAIFVAGFFYFALHREIKSYSFL